MKCLELGLVLVVASLFFSVVSLQAEAEVELTKDPKKNKKKSKN